MYLTGYLTRDKEEKESADGKITLKIPNKEIREIFETTVQDWFSDTAKLQDRKHLFDAVWNGDEQTLTQEISRLLRITISIMIIEKIFIMHFLQEYLLGLDIVLNRIKNMEKVEVILLFLMNVKERLQFLKRNIQKK